MPDTSGAQACADLLWAVNSPSFVTGEQVAPPRPLAESEIDVDALAAFLAERPVHRVGRYFENLLHFWLAHIRPVELIGAGIQLRDGKRTVGELDFVYRCESGELVHCEAAIKFFLHHPRAGVSHYPGPNASDNFELKTTKLFDEQLERSVVHYPQVEVREACVKGMVFYRSDAEIEPAPVRLPVDHLRGSWLRASELEQLPAKPNRVGAIAQKPYWLAPQADAELHAVPDLAAKLTIHFDSGPAHPVMISIRDASTGEEVERTFVVADHWPHRA